MVTSLWLQYLRIDFGQKITGLWAKIIGSQEEHKRHSVNFITC